MMVNCIILFGFLYYKLLERSIDDHLSQLTRSSLDVNVGSLKSAKSDAKHLRWRKKNNVTLEKCISNSFEDRISKWVYYPDNAEFEKDNFCKLISLSKKEAIW